MTTDALRTKVSELLPRIARKAVVPALTTITTSPDYADDETPLGDDDAQVSKFAGRPWLSSEHPWPSCGKCKARMAFVVQIFRKELPPANQPALKGELLQVFWCNDCQARGGSDQLYSKSAMVRELATDGAPIEAPRDDDDDNETITFMRQWQERPDYPSAREEIKWAKVTRDDDLLDSIQEVIAEAAEDEAPEVKVGGWLRWTSAPERVKCRCKASLSPLLQMGSFGPVVGDGRSVTIMSCESCGMKALLAQ